MTSVSSPGRHHGSWNWNGNAFDVPVAVVTVTGRFAEPPEMSGTVTEHLDWVGQLIGAFCSPSLAVIWPSGLNRLDPDSVTTWPTPPCAGLSPESSGEPPGVGGGEVADDACAGAWVEGTVDPIGVDGTVALLGPLCG